MFSLSFTNLTDGILDAIKKEKNAILALCGVSVTILLGLASLGIINEDSLKNSLIINGIIAILVFFSYFVYTLVLSIKFYETSLVVDTTITYLQALRSSFNVITFEKSSDNEEKIENYFIFVLLANCSNKIRMKTEFNRLLKTKLITKYTKEEFSRISDQWVSAIKIGLDMYEISKEEYKKDEWKDFQFIIKELVQYHKIHGKTQSP